MVNLADICRGLNKRLSVFTYELSDDIPNEPGVYGWYLPLWFYNSPKDEIDTIKSIIESVYNYDSGLQTSFPENKGSVKTNWEKLAIKISKESHRNLKSATIKKWSEIKDDESELIKVQEFLLQASLFMPPLYVGKATSLKSRYFQHVENRESEKNIFHTRFKSHMKNLGLQIGVSDLLFLTVNTSTQNDEYSEFIEDVLMKIIKPVFSAR